MASDSMAGKWTDDRLRALAQCIAQATEIARSGIEIDESDLPETDRSLLALGRTMAAAADRRARVQALPLAPNVIDARARFRR